MKWNEYGEIVGVNNAIRKYLNQEVYHNPNPIVLDWLNQNQFKHIVVLLVDALGSSILEKHCDKDGFFLTNTKASLTTVFPPTTSAATTSLRTGKYPNENAWLGWNEYFKEKDDNIILFMNQSQYSDCHYPNFSSNTLPVPFLDETETSTSVWPSWSKLNPSKDYPNLLENILKLIPDYQYIYAYYDELDTFMHSHGPSSKKSKNLVLKIEQETEEFARKLPKDTGLILLADHSQIDVRIDYLDEYPELTNTFLHLPALEARTIAFYIKEDQKDEFVSIFNNLFGNDFVLYTKEDVLKQNIFGSYPNHPRFEEFIGDYLAISTSDLALSYKPNKSHAKKVGGDHAGGLDEEAIIPLILWNN